MNHRPEGKAWELTEALRRAVQRHESLTPRFSRQNGTADLVLSLAGAPAELRALFKVRGRRSVLIVEHEQARDRRLEETIDLKLDEGFCWDEMVCGSADELADILLQHVHRRLESALVAEKAEREEADGG